MSRALDPKVIAALKNGDHAQIYKDISSALVDIDSPCEIEILGHEFPLVPGQSLVREDGALGIPKLRLVQAFFAARKIFMSDRTGTGTLSLDNIRATTAVMLLMDPEHLAAANARKRCLLRDLDGPSAPTTSPSRIAEAFRREACFVDSLLTSPLHRHTKSPVLWSHRRWLVEEQARRGIALSPTALRDTLSHVVMVAGERHPRNYYAWCHARWLVQQALRPASGDASDADMDADAAEVFAEIVGRVRRWCCRNHADISGWSFLLYVLGKGVGHASGLAHRVRQEVSELSENLRWKNESVVWFLDMAAKHQAMAAASSSSKPSI